MLPSIDDRPIPPFPAFFVHPAILCACFPQVNLVDNGIKLPGIQTTSVTLSITVLNVNDPPLLVSSNLTGIPENSIIGSTVYTFVASDEDGHAIAFTIVGGNNNTGVRGACGPLQ